MTGLKASGSGSVSPAVGVDWPAGGEMGALVRATDWSKTPLGAIESWPRSLRTIRPDVAGNGVEAVEAVLSAAYDVVLMDVQMPELEGCEATREIQRRLPPAKRPRIVAMTANATAEDRQVCLDAGMGDYLSKPIAISALIQALQRSAPVAAAIAATEPEVDDAVLRHLASVIGGPDTQEVIDLYLGDVPSRLADFPRGLEQSDLVLAHRAVHTLKSTAASLGALRFADLCAEAESAALRGDLAALRALWPPLEAQLARVVAEIGRPERAAELRGIARSGPAGPTRAAPRPSS